MCSIDSCLNVPSTSGKEALIDTIGFNSVKSLQTGPGCFVLVIVHRFEHSFNVNTERSSCKECEEILTQLYSMQCVMQPWCNRETTRGLHHRHNLESWILKHGRAIATSAKLKWQWQDQVPRVFRCPGTFWRRKASNPQSHCLCSGQMPGIWTVFSMKPFFVEQRRKPLMYWVVRELMSDGSAKAKMLAAKDLRKSL